MKCKKKNLIKLILTMNQRTNYLLSLLLCIVSLSGFASNPDDGDNMYVFTKQSDVPTVYSLDELDKITFNATGINFWNTKWPTLYSYSNFRLITFSPDVMPSGIEQVGIDDDDVFITYDRQQEVIIVKSDNFLSRVAVYDVQGRLVTSANDKANTIKVSLLTLPQGIYLIKANANNGSVSKKIVK